jgi:hypothetical protein
MEKDNNRDFRDLEQFEKFCPILKKDCIREKCAWHAFECCAVWSISENFARFTDYEPGDRGYKVTMADLIFAVGDINA